MSLASPLLSAAACSARFAELKRKTTRLHIQRELLLSPFPSAANGHRAASHVPTISQLQFPRPPPVDATSFNIPRPSPKVANKRFLHKNMSVSENKVAVGLSWQPKLALFSPTTKEKSSTEEAAPALYKPESQLLDGLFVPPNDPRKLNKLFRKQVKDTAGKNWFDMPAQNITPELKKDLQLLKLRGVIDPKRHYKKGDSKSKTLPKYFQVGTVIESASEFFSGRLTKKERKATLAEELLSDGTFHQYRKRKVREIEEHNRPAGVDKWKRSKSKKHGKSNGKKRRH